MNNEEFPAYCMKWTKFWHTVIVGIVLGCCLFVVPVAIWENNKHNEELKNCLVEETRTPNCSLLLLTKLRTRSRFISFYQILNRKLLILMKIKSIKFWKC